ncbi:MAG: DNA cytosine methyltransferase [Actinobacteria bacterium]|nr:DNA cytosine methyltransferase [Actinomycetota bacterium]
MKKILNLYACLGGNRYKWDEVAENLEITAVELNEELAEMYQKRFPKDTVIVGDAHEYLLTEYKKFDFIWSSPPCPTHSRVAFGARKSDKMKHKPVYPDMTLYQEIIFLQHYFNGLYCVENVIPYYQPLTPAQKRGRHLYWTNFDLPLDINERKFDGSLCKTKDEHKKLQEFHDYQCKANIAGYRDVLRNLVDYEAGRTIFETARITYEQRTQETTQ